MSDLISRQSAIEAIESNYRRIGLSHNNGAELERIIKSLPSADRPKGEWVEIEDYAGGIHYQCDKCKEEFILMYGTPKENGYNYCPACGAKMEEKNGKFNKKE